MLIGEDGNFKKSNLLEEKERLEDLSDCNKCDLRKGCNNIVLGEGNMDNKVMFIGEAPGRQEDKKQRPFVGDAGMLLNDIFNAVNINRKEVYITNIVKCRPPGNRTPTEDEAITCSYILKREFEVVNPKLVIPLGSTALNYLVDKDLYITHCHGKWFNKGDIYFLPTFHPAYLLRRKDIKKAAYLDFKKVKASINRLEELMK